jgi:hypothetical protein
VLYKDLYCARGDMENRIKEQFELFADRTSCHHWWPNQFRLLLAGFAYTLLTAIRRLGLTATELARAQVGTIRLRLLKIGAVIWRNTRRIRFCLSSACPDKDLFVAVATTRHRGIARVTGAQSNAIGPLDQTDYLKQLYFDALVFTPEALRHLAAQVAGGALQRASS